MPSNLTAEQILIRSGNIGSVKIGQEVGEQKFKSFLSKIGVLDEISFDIKEVGKPLKLTGVNVHWQLLHLVMGLQQPFFSWLRLILSFQMVDMK